MSNISPEVPKTTIKDFRIVRGDTDTYHMVIHRKPVIVDSATLSHQRKFAAAVLAQTRGVWLYQNGHKYSHDMHELVENAPVLFVVTTTEVILRSLNDFVYSNFVEKGEDDDLFFEGKALWYEERGMKRALIKFGVFYDYAKDTNPENEDLFKMSKIAMLKILRGKRVVQTKDSTTIAYKNANPTVVYIDRLATEIEALTAT